MQNRPTRVSTTRTASMFCLEGAICSTPFSFICAFFPTVFVLLHLYVFGYLVHICSYREWCSEACIHTRIYPYKTFISSIPSYSILLSKLLVLATCSFVTHRCLFLSATVAILDGRCRSEYHAPD